MAIFVVVGKALACLCGAGVDAAGIRGAGNGEVHGVPVFYCGTFTVFDGDEVGVDDKYAGGQWWRG